MLSLLSLLILSSATALAKHNAAFHKPHHNVPRAQHNATLFERGSGNRFSNYFAGESEGACGWWNTDAEFVVALTQLEWDNGAHCGKEVHISWKGKSTTAKVVDECMECPWDALDFSQSLFSFFVGEGNNEEVGYIYGDWSYTDGSSSGGGGGGGDDTTTTTTTKAKPTTSTTTKAKTTSTTSTTTTSTTSTTSKTTSTSQTTSQTSTSSKPTSTSSTAAASASPTQTATGANNIAAFSQALLILNRLVVDANVAGAA